MLGTFPDRRMNVTTILGLTDTDLVFVAMGIAFIYVFWELSTSD